MAAAAAKSPKEAREKGRHVLYDRQKKKKEPNNPVDDDDDEEWPPDITKSGDPLFNGMGAEGIGNMPELTELLQDEEILKRFQNERTADLLRQIALDSSRIPEIIKEPEIDYLRQRIQEKFDESRRKRQEAARRAMSEFEDETAATAATAEAAATSATGAAASTATASAATGSNASSSS